MEECRSSNRRERVRTPFPALPWAGSAGPPGTGSWAPFRSQLLPRTAPGTPSLPAPMPWWWRPPAPAKPSPPSSGRWTGCWFRRLPRLLNCPGWTLPAGKGRRPRAPKRKTRVLYISPLKALGVDVERNLRSPLIGITQTAKRLGLPAPLITVGVRSGDTTTADRRALLSNPPDILITTPESLFLMLTSRARETLTEVDTIIVDEVHAVAGTKRGAHLAVSLERLDALLPKPAQRIGLSATVEPRELVAQFLAGSAPVEIVAPPSRKNWDLTVSVPVEDMSDLQGAAGAFDSGPASGLQPQASIWPHVEEKIVDLVLANQSTIVFANSRRLAERLTARLNEIYAERQLVAVGGGWGEPEPGARLGSAGGRSGHGCSGLHGDAGPHDGAGRQHGRRRSGAGPRPPRLRLQGPAGPDRGRPQVRPAALRCGHLVPGTRHRHGRRGPRGAGGVPAVGGQRPATGGPCRPPGGRNFAGRALPQAPGRPRAYRHHGGTDAGGKDRAALCPCQSAGHPGPADRRGHRPGQHRRGGMVRHGPAVRALRVPPPVRVRGHP